jgi:hypothetical protein
MSVHRDAAVRTPSEPRRRAQPVTTIQVRLNVWTTARQLAGGRTALLQVLSPVAVRVLDARYEPPR